MAVLVTGGMGYIGSHTTVELLKEGYEVVIVDNLSNSKELVKDRIKAITGKEPKFYKYDVLNKEDMDKVFSENAIDSVIHFAGFKAVGESVAKPLDYYHNNLTSTFVLLELMRKYGVKNFVFSSSATVYGDAKIIPITEEAPLSATNPYGRTKLMLEEILRDLYSSDNSWNIALLRYFNPVGAHESGTIGEDPCGIPNNLMPFITKVAIGELKELSVFGDDYDTPDGTGVRDYIHVVDLAKGHLKALEKLKTNSGLVTYNLGTGNGYSVLDIVKAFSEASGREIPYKITARRPGDIATCYSEPRKANEELGWTAEKGIKEMCEDSWRWQSQNPKGYEE
ncbi:UDP-galactose-4-epimerase [Clostridium sulfidigenes]|uniref:UDP-glucose 4-epimerase n=1 Tax=Clostridium sulfidigenes TaxID=318464 RepID=A0A084JDR9_9CLOT|nr:UDP-glucose 4-epimerase GalE [Clostridium sulfidigenes]KEZ87103.1 UDP-galactose-4-epimerase [Clostridium sulfidigenes]HAR85242.1 UDP-glucose 4-epimerase GalE [Clostridium sp.]HCO74892.1 UDP-glucose 4-epimerase GalE [Clostridium sp.]